MTDVQTLIFYIIIFNISAFFAGRYQKFMSRKIICTSKSLRRKRLILILCIVVPIILMQGLRLNVGTDYQNYLWRFNRIASNDFFYIKVYMKEPIYLIECILLSKITRNAVILFFTDAVLLSLIVFKTFDYYRDKINLQMAYIMFYSVVYMMFVNIERQGIACAIVWYSFRYIQEKNFKKFALVILLACGFHTTSILFLPLYLITVCTNYKKIIRILITVGVMAFPILTKVLVVLMSGVFSGARSGVYLNESASQIKFTALMYPAMFYLSSIMILLTLKKKNAVCIYDFKADFSYQLIFICDAMTMLFLMSESVVSYGSRFCFYVYFGLVVGSAAVLKNIRNKTARNLLVAFFYLISIGYFIRIYFVLGQAEVFPYRSVFEL